MCIGAPRPVELAGVLPASPHCDCRLCRDCRAIPGQTVSVLIHDHARQVHAHIVVHVVPMGSLSGILGPGLPRESQCCSDAEQERPNHLLPQVRFINDRTSTARLPNSTPTTNPSST